MKGSIVGLFALGLWAVTACAPPPSQMAVNRWLLCEECNRGELDSVVQFGDGAVGQLANALDGPSTRERAWIHQQSADRYRELNPATIVDSIRYVSHYDSNFVATYQAHAATALGGIGTPYAREALHQAMRNDTSYRQDVIRAFSRAAPVRLGVVTGNGQAAPRDSLVAINPTVRVVDSVTGQPLVGIGMTFTVRLGSGRIGDSVPVADSVVVRRTDGNGVASVPWLLGSGPDSANVLSAETFRRSVTLYATSHGLVPRLVFTVQPGNLTLGQPFAPAVRLVVLDARNRLVTTFTGPATASILGTGVMTTEQVVAGKVELSNLIAQNQGTGFQIRVEVPGATPAESQPFDVAP
jgi:hypothetical protein